MSINPTQTELYKQLVIRENLMEGKLELPTKYYDISNDHIELMDSMFQALWYNYLKDKGSIATPTWHDRFNDSKIFYKFNKALAKDGWVESPVIPARHWGEMSLKEDNLLKLVTEEELEHIRAYKKFTHYILDNKQATTPNKTKLNGKVQDTGLVRRGFMRAGNTEFQFDTVALQTNYEGIRLNLTKSMDKINDELVKKYGVGRTIDSTDYAEVSTTILDYHMNHKDAIFTRGENINDSRGRAISSSLKKVFNPISNKDARSLLVIPEEHREITTKTGIRNVYLFIAELQGFKSGSKFQKVCAGTKAYNERKLHDLECEAQDATNEEMDRAEHDRKELHENMWLERLYKELDLYYLANEEGLNHYWSVPIEIDASALTKSAH